MMSVRLPKEQKDRLVTELQQYFDEEFSEPIGNLAAEQLLDFFIRQAGPHIYNQAVHDCRQFAMERFAAMEEEMCALEKTPPSKR
ncbi:hypothetical protein SK3146_06563 [Paenibacillus konkukensis]|uniref:DUF2164 domain-containing protein n=1 Tax=Paenibacillus konkukensis TaxID=2020716 RepID=A0ABY4S0F8_9BACL|nr:DUF2164 domain-containing protein [Paenibacillus konkukensis]UQZ87266.1 hypothetical protein SK3146_06563 [Paenibacillus konkukensis]